MKFPYSLEKRKRLMTTVAGVVRLLLALGARPRRPHHHNLPITTVSQTHSLATVDNDRVSNGVSTTTFVSQVRPHSLRCRWFLSSPGFQSTARDLDPHPCPETVRLYTQDALSRAGRVQITAPVEPIKGGLHKLEITHKNHTAQVFFHLFLCSGDFSCSSRFLSFGNRGKALVSSSPEAVFDRARLPLFVVVS
ncbi:hypothetical protein TIFTF001_029134 [Ficus carica]|uniref:Uncharacterized protein n=1 Tax=Ficus carica TaxID=3494 RepID=A0AA88DR98_FICCA|nr:hypothetical protein TIFTF001_029134 [Ficus carica]